MNTKIKKQRSPVSLDQHIQFKDVQLLKKFITEHGKILPQHRTKLTKKQQRELKKAVKRARILSLLPFTIKD